MPDQEQPSEREYRLLYLGGSDVTFFDGQPGSSQPDLAQAELQRRHPGVRWTTETELLYPSLEMAARAKAAVDRVRPDAVVLLLGANTFIEETVLFAIRRKYRRFYPPAARVIGLGKQAAGGGAEGSDSARGLLFRLPRLLARSMIGTSSLIDIDVAMGATEQMLEYLSSEGIPVMCRQAGGGVQQTDQKEAAEVKARAYNGFVKETCERLGFPCWRLVDELGERYGWEPDGLHADLPSREYSAGLIADFVEQLLGLVPGP